MGAEKSGLVGHLAGEAQSANFVGDAEPVTAFDLERCRALRARLRDEVGESSAQFVVGRRARRRDGRANAARRVGTARHARLELVDAITGKDEVAVAVDEARDDRRAPSVDARVSGGGFRRIAHPRDPTLVDDERGIDANRLAGFGRVERHQLPNVVDDDAAGFFRGHGAHAVILPRERHAHRSRRASRTRRAPQARTGRRGARFAGLSHRGSRQAR